MENNAGCQSGLVARVFQFREYTWLSGLKHVSSLCVLLLLLVTCKKDTAIEKTAFSVNGSVSQRGKLAVGVTVTVDDKVNLSTETNATGNFTIPGVPKGDHLLKLKKTFASATTVDDAAKAFSEKSFDISVIQDITLQVLMLPGIVLLQDNPGATESTVQLKWSSTDDTGFREYRIYRLNSSGLNETTGSLVHSNFSRVDTTFLDTQLLSQTMYFYRIYTIGDPNRIGGSNIVSSTTASPPPPPPPPALIKNGSFENLGSGNSITDWFAASITGIVTDNTYASEGLRSVKFVFISPGLGCYPQVLQQQTLYTDLVPGAIYKIGFKYRSDFDLNAAIANVGFTDFLMCTGCTGPPGLSNMPIVFNHTANWQSFSANIQAPTINKIYYVTIDFCLPGINGNVWVDEVTLVKN